MDPRLRKRGAETMRDIDRHHARLLPGTFQIEIGEFTPLSDAVVINERMKAGLRGDDALQVFNPEMVFRKVEAEGAMQSAVARMNTSITKLNLKIERSRRMIDNLRERLALGPGNVHVGPSINERFLDREQVVYPSRCDIQIDGDQADRRVTKRQKKRSRRYDAKSQIAFWQLNLTALEAKEAAQVAFRDALVGSRDHFSKSALQLPTRIGSGFSDYTFGY
ncbi:hypothetical protein QOZ80_2BG0155480 [Eleusine coracana subsp. coracana]|nr:hypothetical protein QOZ80_2BG0155480 [Eleusine coracana subsp. coracana]